MATQRGLIPDVVGKHGVPRNGEPADGQSRGDDSPKTGKRWSRSKLPPEKGKGRNLKIPDSIFDPLCVYARTTKVKAIDKKGKEYVRSLTVSEATCKALLSFLPKLRITVDAPADPPAE